MKSILLSFSNGVGNFLMISPLLESLKKHDYNIDILLDHKDTDPRKRALKDIISLYPGIDFYNSAELYDECFYVWGEGNRDLPLKNDWKITKEAHTPKEFFLNQGIHEVELNYKIADYLDIKDEIPAMYCPTIPEDSDKDESIKICIHVGSRPEDHWKKKRWPVNYWVELITRIDKEIEGIKSFYLLCEEWEKDDVNKIMQGLKVNTGKYCLTNSFIRIIDNSSITEVAGIIADADILVTTDSAPMHIGAAVSTYTISLFGCTLLTKNRPWKGKGKILTDPELLKCVPCLYTVNFSTCKDNICMKNITPNMVFNEVKEYCDKNIKHSCASI